MENPTRNTLPKKERLCGKNNISLLLAKGKHGNVPGLKYCWMPTPDKEFTRILVSVPKKMFRRAVKRNLLKRRIRESWRVSKNLLQVNGGIDILFTYSTKEIMEYSEILSAIAQIMEKVNAIAAKNEADRQKKDETR